MTWEKKERAPRLPTTASLVAMMTWERWAIARGILALFGNPRGGVQPKARGTREAGETG